jgi:hypothetical protein
MTVLSRALTGDTPKERLDELCRAIEMIQTVAMPEALAVQALNEHFTNERALFISAVRGEIKVTDGPSEAVGESPVPATPSVTPPAPPGVANPTPAGNQDDAERATLIKRLMDYSSSLWLPKEVYNRLSERGPVDYPDGTTARLEYLRELPMSWLKYVVTGAGK